MITLQISTEVGVDRQVVLTLPAEVPVGPADLTVIVVTPNGKDTRKPRTSLAEWAEQNAENWGERLSSERVEDFTGRRF